MAIKKELVILSILLILASTLVSAQLPAKGAVQVPAGTLSTVTQGVQMPARAISTVTTPDPCAFAQNLRCEQIRSDAAERPDLCQMKCQGGLCESVSVPSINPGLAGLVSRCPGLNSRMCYVCKRTQQTATLPQPQTTQVLMPPRTQLLTQQRVSVPVQAPTVSPPQQDTEFAFSCRKMFNLYESKEDCKSQCGGGSCMRASVLPLLRKLAARQGREIPSTGLENVYCWACFPESQITPPVTQVTPPQTTSVLEEITSPTVSQALQISPSGSQQLVTRIQRETQSFTQIPPRQQTVTPVPRETFTDITQSLTPSTRLLPPSAYREQALPPSAYRVQRQTVTTASKPSGTLSITSPRSQVTQTTRVTTSRTTMPGYYPPSHTSAIPSRRYGLQGTPSSTQPANVCGQYGLYKDVLQCNSFCKFPSRCVSKQVPGAACFVCSRATSIGGGGLGIMAG